MIGPALIIILNVLILLFVYPWDHLTWTAPLLAGSTMRCCLRCWPKYPQAGHFVEINHREKNPTRTALPGNCLDVWSCAHLFLIHHRQFCL